MNANIKTPGMANIFWMPIQTRTEMLTTGFRSKLGIKIFGPDLGKIQEIGLQIEKALSDFPDTRSVLCRAHHRRLFPRLQCQPRDGRALWPNGGRRSTT